MSKCGWATCYGNPYDVPLLQPNNSNFKVTPLGLRSEYNISKCII